MFFARTELATSMLSDRILAVGAPVCARVVALNGLTRQGFPLRCLKRTRVSRQPCRFTQYTGKVLNSGRMRLAFQTRP